MGIWSPETGIVDYTQVTVFQISISISNKTKHVDFAFLKPGFNTVLSNTCHNKHAKTRVSNRK